MGDGHSTLADAIQADDETGVANLIAAGLDVNGKSDDGWAVLTNAIMGSRTSIVQLLLSAGARPNTHEHDDPLYWAAAGNKVEIVRLLIDAGATLAAIDPFGAGVVDTALHAAAERGNIEVIRLLLKSNAGDFFKSFNELSWSPLHCAVKEGHLDAVKALLSAGADPNVYDENNCGDPALKLAISYKRLDVARALLNAGADPTKTGWMGLNSIDKAEKLDTPEAQELLSALRAAAAKLWATPPSDD